MHLVLWCLKYVVHILLLLIFKPIIIQIKLRHICAIEINDFSQQEAQSDSSIKERYFEQCW